MLAWEYGYNNTNEYNNRKKYNEDEYDIVTVNNYDVQLGEYYIYKDNGDIVDLDEMHEVYEENGKTVDFDEMLEAE